MDFERCRSQAPYLCGLCGNSIGHVVKFTKRYIVANAPKIHQLKTDIASCKQLGLEVVEFYSKLRGMWNELENYLMVPHCACGKCKCDAGAKVIRMTEEEKTYQLLMGLEDKSFSTIRS